MILDGTLDGTHSKLTAPLGHVLRGSVGYVSARWPIKHITLLICGLGGIGTCTLRKSTSAEKPIVI